MHNTTSKRSAPAGKAVHINAATALLVERLQERHQAVFGSTLSAPRILQRACEIYWLEGPVPRTDPERTDGQG